MLRPAIALSLLFGFGSLHLRAQIPPEISFCSAGVQADGFLNWTKLPAPPSVPGGQTAPPLSATIPVEGVSGLTATVQITPTGNTPKLYSIVNPADLNVIIGHNSPVTITFSKPVKGVSVQIRTFGRFGHNFFMTANDTNGGSISGPPPEAEVASSGFDYPSQQLSTVPLQILSDSANLNTVTVGLTSGEYFAFDLLNFRVQSGSAPDAAAAVSKTGLKAWFRADQVTGDFLPNFPSGITAWPDASGNGANAMPPSQASAPLSILDGGHCTPVVSFNGAQLLNFNLPINGWTEMTVILAAQAYTNQSGSPGTGQNAALFWNENGNWGSTFFSPFQTTEYVRFGTTQVNNQPVLHRPVNVGGDFTVTTAVHNNTTDALYVNGLLALQQGGKYAGIAGTVATGTIGGGYGGTYFTGNIGEILIYDRVLTNAERAKVEQYLMSKYGVR